MADRRITIDGTDLVDRWCLAKRHERDIRRELVRAECETRSAENALAKWLVPSTAKAGEVFVLPIGGAFLEVLVVQSSARCATTGERSKDVEYVVRWRDGKEPVR